LQIKVGTWTESGTLGRSVTAFSELEDRIADRREFFNDDVNAYNTRIGQIPEVFVASFMSLKPRAFFKVSDDDRKLVEVKFQSAAGA
jgi:LemA protein